MEEVQYCENCKRNINAKNYVIHTAFCARQIQLCNRCSEPVPRTERERHEEEFHSKAICSDCGISLEKWQIEKHKETCVKKLVPCEYCELEVPLDNLSEHSTACGSRTEQCSKCNKHVLIKDIEKHTFNCLKTEQDSVPCEYCGVHFVWNELTEHTILCGTRTERCFVCNEHVMVQDRDTHIVICEKSLDFDESVSCDYCGDSFTHNNIKKHIEFCGSRSEKCKECSHYIQKKDMKFHRTTCEKKKKLRLQFPCNFCGELFPTDSLEDHSNKCGSQTQKCLKCDTFIPMKNMKTHSDKCGEKKKFNLQFPCDFCERLFPTDSLEDHSNICGSQTQKCLKCDKFIQLKNMKAHSDVCKVSTSKVLGNCPVCHQSVPWVDMNVHSANCARIYYEAPEYERQNKFNEHALRKESEDNILMEEKLKEKKSKLSDEFKRCPFCFEIFLSRDLTPHLESCQERPYNCDMCLKPMPYHKKEMHILNCRSQQREKHYEDYVHHDEETDNKKLKKLKKCQFCDKRFTDVLFQHHLKECDHREEKCTTCSKNVPVKNMQKHKLNECNFDNLPGNKNFYHADSKHNEAIPELSKSSERMRDFEERVELCPSCNCKIPEERYHGHLLLCYNDRTQCHFCGEEIPKKNEHSHLQVCYKILAMSREDNKSLSTKKKEKTNKENILEKCMSLFSKKDKSSERNYTRQNYQESKSRQPNEGNYEKGQPPYTRYTEVVNELPCEFCNQMYPAEMLIEHESGCRPDLVSFPKTNEGYDNDQKFATATAAVSPISVMPVLGARPKYSREENDGWKQMQFRSINTASVGGNIGYKPKNTRDDYEGKEFQSKRNNQASIGETHTSVSGARPKNSKEESKDWKEMQHSRNKSATENNEWKKVSFRRNNQASVGENIDYAGKERNVHQNQSNVKDGLFFYSSKDTAEASKTQFSTSGKNRHSQLRVFTETSKIKSDKEFVSNCEVKKNEPEKDNFTTFKFSSSKFNEELQNDSNFRKENDAILSGNVKNPHETKESNNFCHLRAFSGESNPKTECSKPFINREIKAVGAERIEKKKIMNLKKDGKEDLTLMNRHFEQMTLQNPIIYDENSESEPTKIPETNNSKILSFSLPMIWNTEYNSNSDKTFSSPLLKSLSSKYDNETNGDTLSNVAENTNQNTLNSTIQDADYDAKNDETFGIDFLKTINKNEGKEDENDTHSNSDDTFYDADDGSMKYFETDNIHGSSNTQDDKLSHYHLDNLNIGTGQETKDLSGYIQFLRRSIKESDEAIEKNISELEKLTSLRRNASSSSESSDTEPVVAGVKTLNQKKSKKSLSKSNGKVNTEVASNEALKWKKWREVEVSDSD